MPIDFPSLVYDALMTRTASGITTFNLACAGLNIPPVDPNSLFDLRTFVDRKRIKDDKTILQLFPRLWIEMTGSGELVTTTPTFGLYACDGCDTIVPLLITLVHTIAYDTNITTLAQQMTFESYIDASIKAGYPKFGIPCCREYSCFDSRQDDIRKRTYSVIVDAHIGDIS